MKSKMPGMHLRQTLVLWSQYHVLRQIILLMGSTWLHLSWIRLIRWYSYMKNNICFSYICICCDISSELPSLSEYGESQDLVPSCRWRQDACTEWTHFVLPVPRKALFLYPWNGCRYMDFEWSKGEWRQFARPWLTMLPVWPKSGCLRRCSRDRLAHHDDDYYIYLALKLALRESRESSLDTSVRALLLYQWRWNKTWSGQADWGWANPNQSGKALSDYCLTVYMAFVGHAICKVEAVIHASQTRLQWQKNQLPHSPIC